MDRIEQKILDIIESKKEEIMAFGDDIFHHAELGYREFRTSKKFADALKSMGLETEEGLAITGVKSYLKGKNHPGMKICLLGEMDGVAMPTLPHAWSETGAAHACGHHAQITGVLGAAMALTDPEVREALEGDVVFFGVPAEETISLELRNQLASEGKIKYNGGKCNLLAQGYFDDIDLIIASHLSKALGIINITSNTSLRKKVTYTGKVAHAALDPHTGIDALNAMGIAQHAIALQRESFRDEDSVRVHGIITQGGEATNVIADHVTAEFNVRAKTLQALKDTNYKVDRALKSGAVATGCGVEIETVPGYMPVTPARDLTALLEAIDDVCAAQGPDFKVPRFHMGADGNAQAIKGSTDFGDLSSVVPFVKFGTAGMAGKGAHASDMDVNDPYSAYVITAKVFALAAYKMLKNKNDYARRVLDLYEPTFTKEQYIAYMESMTNTITMDMVPVPEFD